MVRAIVMHAYFAEFIGTALLILLGNGVVANVVLPGTVTQVAPYRFLEI
jgi:glycerol uptake facilitator-like aquaporin